MRDRLRWATRFVLASLMIGSLAMAGWNGWFLLREPMTRALVTRTGDGIAARLDAALHRRATPEAVAAHLRDLLAADPRDWARIEAMVELAGAMEITLPEDLAAELARADADDRSYLAVAQTCVLCAWDVANCDLSAALLCRVGVDLTPAGDISGLAREAGHYVTGAEVDELDMALSAVGLLSLLLAPMTGGTSMTIKTGSAVARTAWRMGALTASLVDEVRRIAMGAVDWTALRNAARSDAAGDLRRHVDLGRLAPIGRAAGEIGEMRAAIGIRKSLFMLRSAENTGEVRALGAVAKASPRKAPGALEFLGKSRLERIATRYSDEMLGLLRAGVVLFLTTLGLFGSILKACLLRSLRRLAR